MSTDVTLPKIAERGIQVFRTYRSRTKIMKGALTHAYSACSPGREAVDDDVGTDRTHPLPCKPGRTWKAVAEHRMHRAVATNALLIILLRRKISFFLSVSSLRCLPPYLDPLSVYLPPPMLSWSTGKGDTEVGEEHEYHPFVSAPRICTSATSYGSAKTARERASSASIRRIGFNKNEI